MRLGSHPRQNLLIAALPPRDLERWLPLLSPVDLHLHQVLREPGRIPRHAYFPTTATVSVQYLNGEGTCDEIAVVGREGMIGASLYMDGESTLARSQVQAAGDAYMMPAEVLQEEFEKYTSVMHILLRYALARSAQVAQMAVCNRHHSVEQRLCRRLLQGLDRQPGRDLLLTHEQLSELLGVRRESVTTVANDLRRAGLIVYSRGRIGVLDPAGIERRACACYSVIEREYRRLLPGAAALYDTEQTPPLQL
jgi:CRP-like cAMP-binding protein